MLRYLNRNFWKMSLGFFLLILIGIVGLLLIEYFGHFPEPETPNYEWEEDIVV